MERFWQAQPEKIILWLAVLAVITAIAYYIRGKIRPRLERKEPTASYWLTKFQELHAKGELSDEEFRTVKTILARQLQEELKDNGDKGSNE